MKVRIGTQSLKVNSAIPLLQATLLMITFTAYHIWKIVPIFYFGLAGLLICLVAMPVKKLLQLSFLLAPNIMAIKLSHDASALFGYFFIFVFLKYILINRKITVHWSAFLFIISISITAIIYDEYALILTGLRCFLFFLAIYTFFSNDWCTDLAYRESLLQSYICGVTLCVICGFAYYALSSFNILSGYFGGINNGRNFFSSLLSSGIALTLIYISHSKRSYIFHIFAIILMLIAGILSNSRTFLASLGFVLILFSSMFTKRKMRLLATQIILIGLTAILLFGDAIIPSLSNVLNRFAQDDVAGANGRVEAWMFYISKTVSSLPRFLFGNGLAQKYVVSGEIAVVEHSSIVELFSTVGVVGTIVALQCFYNLFHSVVKKRKALTFVDFVPFFCSLTCFLMLSAMFSDILNFSLLISFLAADYNIRMRIGFAEDHPNLRGKALFPNCLPGTGKNF